ncbi:unnamed protein product [Orchesella dallaii]|uniref:Uncharacterized protein n=1 Tax=Orchesella dallaii TaxID=48710 RepID=A0ABP1PU87_9HEXA
MAWTNLLCFCFLQFIFVQIFVGVKSDKLETEDDKLISHLLNTSGNNGDAEGSQVSQILKAIEVAEIRNKTSTPVSAPKISSRNGQEDSEYDEVIEYLERSFREAHGIDKNGQKVTPAEKRSHHHHEPALENLLWGTAKAVWNVGSPVFYRTSAGRKISLIQDTVTLPIRTFGWLRKRFLDLTRNPHRRRLIPRSHHHYNHDHDLHDHDHGWGWGEGPVYVRYEPENSLFHSWLKYLYRAIKPAVITKIRLKQRLVTTKFRVLRFLFRFLKAAKVQKILGAVRAISNRIVKAKLRPDVVVLKEAPKGWHSRWKLWPSWTTTPAPVKSGWKSSSWMTGPPPGWSPTPAPTHSYGVPPPKHTPYSSYRAPPPPKQGYSANNIPEIIYGAPSEAPTNFQRYTYQDATPPPEPSPPVAYSNYHDPSQVLTAPSDNHVSQVELPSYAKYLSQLGIDPANLESLDSTRSMRQSEKEEDVPYVIPDNSETSSDDSTDRMEDAKEKKMQ